MNLATNTPDFIRHIYKVERITKTYTVYELVETQNGNSILPTLCRIEDFQGKSNVKNIDKYFRIRTCTNWQKSEMVTALKKTSTKNLFYGDKLFKGKQNLIVFIFNEDHSQVIIDYYRGFYPYSPTLLKNILQSK